MKKTYNCLFVIAMSIMLITACNHFKMETPYGFAELKNDNKYKFRAVSANNSVFTINQWDNDEEASTDFWYKVSLNYLIQKKGYKFVEEGKIKTNNDIEGKYGIFETLFNGIKTRYMILIFADDSKIINIEYTGAEKDFKTEFEVIKKAINEMTVG